MQTPDEQLAKTIVDANVAFYAESSGHYDDFHNCLKSATQERYRRELLVALEQLPSGTSRPLVLDAATGTGSLTFLLAEMGCEVVALDVSAAMLRLLAGKLQQRKLSGGVRLVESEVNRFLQEGREQYDLIAFGSALHHFPYYARTVALAANRLRPGGVLYIGLEPAALSSAARHRLDRRLCRVDYLLALALRTPGAFIGKLFRKLAPPSSPASPTNNLGTLAEYYAESGIDQTAILDALRQAGMTVVTVSGRYGGKYRVIRALKRLLVREPDEFSLLARKNSSATAE